MSQCLMCGKIGWFTNDVCSICIPAIEEKSVNYLKKLEKSIKLEKITKDSRKRINYCKDIIDNSKKLFTLYKAGKPKEIKNIENTIIKFTKLKFDLEWDVTRLAADKLMKRAKEAVTLEGRLNYAKKALLELRKLKKRRPKQRENVKLLEYIESGENFVKNEQAKNKNRKKY